MKILLIELLRFHIMQYKFSPRIIKTQWIIFNNFDVFNFFNFHRIPVREGQWTGQGFLERAIWYLDVMSMDTSIYHILHVLCFLTLPTVLLIVFTIQIVIWKKEKFILYVTCLLLLYLKINNFNSVYTHINLTNVQSQIVFYNFGISKMFRKTWTNRIILKILSNIFCLWKMYKKII